MKSKHVYFSFCIGLALVALSTPIILYAQTPSESESLALTRRLSFTVIGNLTEKLYYRDAENEYQPLPYGVERAGPLLGFVAEKGASTTLRLFKKSENEAGEILYTVAAENTFPSTWASVQILIRAADGQIQMLPLNDSLDALNYGEVRFYNFSDSEIGVLLGKEQARLKFRESHNYHLVQGENTRLQLRILRNTGGEWVDFLSTSMKPRNTNIRINMLTLQRPAITPGAPPLFDAINLRGNDLKGTPASWLRP